MAEVKISQLPFSSCVDPTALIPIVQNGVTCSTYACNIGAPPIMIQGSGCNSTLRCGSGNTASALYSSSLGGTFNTSNGCFSTILNGCGNSLNSCNTTANGISNAVYVSDSYILSGSMNVIACDALPNSQSGSYFNGFCSGVTTLCSCFGDLTSYYTAGSTLSTQYAYGNPQLNYVNLVVCGSSFSGGQTTICVNSSINTCSGYIIKTGTFSTYSSYHPNVIAGGAFNTINGYPNGATISGGYCNTMSNGYGVIAGGYGNFACNGGVISGGGRNISVNSSVVVAGRYNCSTGFASSILSGIFNIASGTNSTTITGGNNTASSQYSSVLNGVCNISSCNYSTILGGTNNNSCNSFSVVSNGSFNTASGQNSIISNGYCNLASACYSSILNGCCNTSSANNSAIINGICNVADGAYSVILGGTNNNTCGITGAVIIGGGICANRGNSLFVNNISITDIPTSPVGLPTGAVWSNGGVLTIV